jgi:hypothetical protein
LPISAVVQIDMVRGPALVCLHATAEPHPGQRGGAGELSARGDRVMKVKTSVKAGGLNPNHNEAMVRVPSLKVQTSIKAGGIIINE